MNDSEKKLAFLLATSPHLILVGGTSTYEKAAMDLIANGVTFATDNHVGGKWIPVTERLPEVGQEVITCTLHRFGDKSVSAKTFWTATYANWQDVTHWMPLPSAEGLE